MNNVVPRQSVYVVVAEDRHSDPEITVHLNMRSADQAVVDFQLKSAAYYSHRDLEWEATAFPDTGGEGWILHLDAGDDMPKVRIERCKVRIRG